MKVPSRHTASAGFTLVEMSIVIVIIGLLIGGILMGQNLFHAAHIRSVYTDAQSYITAIGYFHDKYESLPGDMYNAESVWGTAAAGAACDITNNSDKTTCSGNGNGRIEWGVVVGAAGTETNEMFRAWQQLNNADMIAFKATGIAGGAGTYDAVPGSNVPSSRITGAGFTLVDAVGPGLNPAWFIGPTYNNALYFGATTPTTVTQSPALSAADAESIDKKIDDGKPGTGSVVTYTNSYYPSCASSDTAGTATYVLSSSTSRVCNMIFITGF